MVRILHTISVFTIISAAGAFVFCAVWQLQDADKINHSPVLSIIEKFNIANGKNEKKNNKIVHPLVEQAQHFASYLNPPKPKLSKIRKVLTPEKRTLKAVNQKITTTESTKLKPKFTLVGISYYRSNPEKSMALVSEPGKGVYWVKKGSNLGHFVVEKIERRKIVYKDGKQLRQMVVDTKATVPIKQTTETRLASDQRKLSQPGHASPPKTKQNTKPRKPMYRLGPPRPEIRPVAYNHKSVNG
jgi:hypothetical protein